MDPIESLAPAGSWSRNESTATGRSVYFDAVDAHILDFDQQTPDKVLEQQLSLLEEDSDENINSMFVYGAKPAWGWDYVLSFKIPRSMRAKKDQNAENAPGPSRRRLGLGRGTPAVVSNENDFEPDEAANMTTREAKDAQESENMICKRVEILARLKSAGFVFSQLHIPSEGVILVRLSLPQNRMKKKATKLGMELRLKEEYGGGYLAFSLEREEAFVNHDDAKARNSYFSPADRAIIILNVLQSKEDWGCDLNIERLLYEKTILQAFAIHSELEQKTLIAETVWKRLWDPTYVPPFNALKDYLGARVTFYFVFVSFYARRLLIIALLSIPVYVTYRVLRKEKVIAILRWVFSIGLVLWTTVFLEMWKRRNANINIEWGLDDYKEDTADDTRAQYVGDIRYGFYCEGGFVSLADLVEATTDEQLESPVSAEEGTAISFKNPTPSDLPKNAYQDPKAARNACLQSLGVTAFFVVLVGSLTFLLLWFRNEVIDYFFDRTGHEGFSNAVPGILNGILITVFDSIWRSVSMILTQRENHRTNQLFENSLVFKRFAFQFVSNYISLFYIAFIKPYLRTNTCRRGYFGTAPDCMVELEFQLMSLVITKATIGQVTELGIPFVTSRVKQYLSRRRSPASLPASVDTQAANASSAHNRYVTEAHLSAYTTTMEDYGELVVQFGYLVLFGLAFPPAAVVALLNNLIEGRTDGLKVLGLSQRVSADDAADIGAWYAILEGLNVLSVATNAGLVVFTADAAGIVVGFDEETDVWRRVLYRVVAFFVMEHVLLGVKIGAGFAIADVPAKTRRRKAREMYEVARVFDVGWRDAFRGNSLLEVDERQTGLCRKYAEVFEVASEDERGS